MRETCQMERLFHIARLRDWNQAKRAGRYRISTLGKRLDEEGFIHLSFAHQVKGVADANYRGMSDLLLLELDPAQLDSRVVVEAVEDAGESFPHLYGEIMPKDVNSVRTSRPRSDGTFDAVT